MYGTYLRLDITVHDSWRAVVRAAARNRKVATAPREVAGLIPEFQLAEPAPVFSR